MEATQDKARFRSCSQVEKACVSKTTPPVVFRGPPRAHECPKLLWHLQAKWDSQWWSWISLVSRTHPHGGRLPPSAVKAWASWSGRCAGGRSDDPSAWSLPLSRTQHILGLGRAPVTASSGTQLTSLFPSCCPPPAPIPGSVQVFFPRYKPERNDYFPSSK